LFSIGSIFKTLPEFIKKKNVKLVGGQTGGNPVKLKLALLAEEALENHLSVLKKETPCSDNFEEDGGAGDDTLVHFVVRGRWSNQRLAGDTETNRLYGCGRVPGPHRGPLGGFLDFLGGFVYTGRRLQSALAPGGDPVFPGRLRRFGDPG
jgi:hypothetical protein